MKTPESDSFGCDLMWDKKRFNAKEERKDETKKKKPKREEKAKE